MSSHKKDDDAPQPTSGGRGKGRGRSLDLLYDIYDTPPWYLSILMGLQHYLTMFGSTFAIAMIVPPALCIGADKVAQSEILSTLFFVSGLVTLLQTTIGTRLPIVQGGTFSYLAPTFAILALPKWQCPAGDGVSNIVNGTWANGTHPAIGTDEHQELWKSRMREIQGAVLLASLFQVAIGLSGAVGFLLRFIGPLCITPTITLIGLALFNAASSYSSKQWWIAIMMVFLVTLFSQYIRKLKVPCCGVSKQNGKQKCTCSKMPVFELFPVILAILISWLICYILTLTNVLPETPGEWGHEARTDTKSDVLKAAKWFRFPYPCQWGVPTFSTASVFGMLAGVLAGIIESIGDYYACARLSGAPPPPAHAINRGIFIEGIGSILSALWGTSNGTTSYSENIGAIGITKIGSRRVIQFGALIMMIFALIGKFGALFVTIPDPIIGGMFMVMFGMIVSVGISNLQFVDMNSSRNLYIVGFSIFFGLCMPLWLGDHPGVINTTVPILDQIITVLLSTSMFVGGLVGFVLDNTIPGTPEERGILAWREMLDDKTASDADKDKALKCYDLPLITRYIKKWSWTRYFPLCPTFDERACCKKTHNKDSYDVQYGPNGEIYVVDMAPDDDIHTL